VKFGVCCNPDQAPQVIATGFDYTELPAGRNFYQGPERPRDHWQTLKVEATNLFIVGELMLVGPDKGDIRGYAENVIAKAAAAGVEVMVVGSGTARRSPAGYDLDAAEDDFFRAMGICHEIAQREGVILAPESLVPAETNVGNFLGDLAKMLAYKGIQYTADSYHVLNQPGAAPSEEWYWEAEMPTVPAHVHLSTTDRKWNVLEDPNLAGFIRRLKSLGYDQRMSLECQWSNLNEELPKALEQVHALWG